MGEHAAGDGEGEELLQLLPPLLLGQLLEEGVLPSAEDLYPLEGEVLVEAAQLEPRPVDLRDGDLPDEPGPASDAFEVQRVVFPQVELQEVQDAELSFDLGGHACPSLLPARALASCGAP